MDGYLLSVFWMRVDGDDGFYMIAFYKFGMIAFFEGYLFLH